MKNMFCYETKIGKISIVENGSSITHMHLGEITFPDATVLETPLIKKAFKQLQEYLNGTRKIFDLPLAPEGTEFQQKVWNALQQIPYGKTCSYKDIAKNIGNINACRAVGMANNKNPIAIFIPCHRVIGSNGNLIGYAGGLEMKEQLLNLEKQNMDK
ncbi:methylated-DNA--[protein]-cysteine S-methyltransferase [Clostridium drakei]|uniref:Methylated-DNA--protein-cysteine methyltransferase n=1 Tax=Clostridium drakei TaxID=332101 RepID=A0A2U8DYP0_9CLOT|nr:methylated-DNA--[protein]-cysteine S-methyltransferase [Clostridium drakei]AWI07779.1 cysteine methyltransferase [Clostridium drakei]